MPVERVPRPEWEQLPQEGCVDVEGRVHLIDDGLLVAELRFGEHGTIHEHPAPHDIDVVCLEGRGFTSIAGDVSPIAAGERVRWPADAPHRLWTDGHAMRTLMIERLTG